MDSKCFKFTKSAYNSELIFQNSNYFNFSNTQIFMISIYVVILA